MKKVLSVLLALTLVLTMLAGCQKAGDDKAQAQATVENYMTALVNFNFKEASSYTSDPAKLMENAPFESLDDAVASAVSALPQEFQKYEDSVNKFADATFGVMLASTSYEILNIEKDGEGYSATVKLTTVDTTNFDVAVVMSDLMTEINVEELLLELFENGTINENMSDEELYDILFPTLFDKMTEAVKDIEVTTVTTEETLNIINVDGKWVIDAGTL